MFDDFYYDMISYDMHEETQLNNPQYMSMTPGGGGVGDGEMEEATATATFGNGDGNGDDARQAAEIGKM